MLSATYSGHRAEFGPRVQADVWDLSLPPQRPADLAQEAVWEGELGQKQAAEVFPGP